MRPRLAKGITKSCEPPASTIAAFCRSRSSRPGSTTSTAWRMPWEWGGSRTRLLLVGHAVMRGDYLPFAARLDPAVCEAVVIVVGLSIRLAFLVVGAVDDRGVAVHSNL